MVQSKADRERQKLITDKCQSLIEVLLKDEDNKYCVDCDAKGPRWASWNLGVFLCIRCAGIHRNLGVHISKVKSVNLDAWTPEHVAYVQRMGNSRARAIYEANLPDDFRRPQTDTALESFIRAKYEHKKYIAQDYVDPGPPAPAFDIDEELKRMKEQKRSKVAASVGTTRMISVPDHPSNPKPRPAESTNLKNKAKTSTPGLVDLETVAATEAASKNSKSTLDLLIGVDLVDSNQQTTTVPPTLTTVPSTQQSNDSSQELSDVFSNAPPTANVSSANMGLDLDLDFSSTPNTQLGSTGAADNSQKVLTKESILSLYSVSSATNTTSVSTPGTDPFGLNNSLDFFNQANSSVTGSYSSNLSASTTAKNNIPAQNLSMMNISSASGLSSLLGSNNNSLVNPTNSDQLLTPFDTPNQAVVKLPGGLTGTTVGQKQIPKTSGSSVKNSSLDELFAGLDILHPKPS